MVDTVESMLVDPWLRITVAFFVESSLIALLGLTLARWLRWDAAKREWLLRVALLCVVMLPAACGLVHYHRIALWDVAPPDLSGSRVLPLPEPIDLLEFTSVPIHDEFVRPESDGDPPALGAATAGSKLTWGLALLAVVWGAGVVVRVARLVIGAVKAEEIARRATAVAPRRIAQALAGSPPTSLSKFVQFKLSDEISSPAAIGLWRPYVVIPRTLLDHLDAAQLRAIILHELAHVQRRDQMWVFVQHVAAALFWPQPLVHLLNRRLTRAREDVCDNFVLRSFHSAEYSRTLLKVASDAQRPPPTFAVSLDSGNWTLEDRIQTILDERRRTMTTVQRSYKTATGLFMAGMALLMATALPTWADDESEHQDLKAEAEFVLATEQEIDEFDDKAEHEVDVEFELELEHGDGQRSVKQGRIFSVARSRDEEHAKPQGEVAELRSEVRQLRSQFEMLIKELRREQAQRRSESDGRAEYLFRKESDGRAGYLFRKAKSQPAADELRADKRDLKPSMRPPRQKETQLGRSRNASP